MNRGSVVRLCVLFASTEACSRSATEESLRVRAPATSVPATLGMNKPWDWNGIIGTGQSLAVGSEGKPLRATSPSYHNLKLDLGGGLFFTPDERSSKLSLVPLQEPIRPLAWRYPGTYPRNIFGETFHTSMASQITALFLRASAGNGDYVTVHSVVGESGQGIRAIAQGAPQTGDTGRAYESSLFEARAIARLAKLSNRTFGIAAVVLTHGETDAINPDYERALHELSRSYNADLAACTGQVKSVPVLLTQQNSCPTDAGTVSRSALSALNASKTHPEDFVCVGPKYQYSYVADGVHLDALGYDRLGEKYGQAYFEHLARGKVWRPLSPTGLERAGKLITVEFHVPVPPLVWDEGLPSPHAKSPPEWATGRGFELSAGDKPVKIEQVEIAGNSVRIHYGGEPAVRLVLRYAATAAAEPRASGARRWGQLRDSDPFVGSTTGQPQPNYAVTFELPVPPR